MPELPDITIYIERLRELLLGHPLQRVRIRSPFLVRTFEPPIDSLTNKTVREFRRSGKRIVFCFDDDLYLVLHLMISGRLFWKPPGVALPGRRGLAAFDFDSGSLLLTEASTRKRASVHVFRGEAALAEIDRGGLEPLEISLAAFSERLHSENRTLKRALTDPRLFSGIGNAYSDEILHAAKLSPVTLTSRLDDEAVARLYQAVRSVLAHWIARTRQEVGAGFPENVTAFRDGMAVHGRFGKPCPACSTRVERIRYANNEVNYCPRCQTEGKLLADRGLSRLLARDWPKTPEELEEYKAERKECP
jgi:formamidopyrimidine-DNA glycosylase